MRASRCTTHGEPRNLTIENIENPTAEIGSVVVSIEAASVNFPDILIVENRYQVSVPTPFTAGSEFAGTVTQVGPDVSWPAVGDRVMGSAFCGAFAEQISVPARQLSPVPKGLDMIHAAAFAVTYRTAYHSLVTIGGLEAGDWVVVLGAAGGVGSAAVDIAVRLGAKVIAAVSSAERAKVCLELGASETIVYTEESLKDRIKEITGAGADLVIDPVGGSYAEQAIRATRWGGRYVCVGFADGEIPRIPMNLILLKGVILRGFEIRTLSDHLPEAVALGDKRIDELVAEGMKPYVSEVFPLSRTPDALTAVRDRSTTGKIVIDTRNEQL
jgi:NADPH2:quinone reductase